MSQQNFFSLESLFEKTQQDVALLPIETTDTKKAYFCCYCIAIAPTRLLQPADLQALHDAKLLDLAEYQMICQLNHPQRRWQKTIGRLWLRFLLQKETGIAAKHWRFSQEAWQKPVVLYPKKQRTMIFNLSHSQEVMACVLSRSCLQLGVDVESCQRQVPYAQKIAERFTQQEQKKLQSIGCPEKQRLYFLRLWTLKEAFAKAVGGGLAVALRQSSFHWQSHHQSLEAQLSHQPTSSWRFIQKSIKISGQPEHVLSIAYLKAS